MGAARAARSLPRPDAAASSVICATPVSRIVDSPTWSTPRCQPPNLGDRPSGDRDNGNDLVGDHIVESGLSVTGPVVPRTPPVRRWLMNEKPSYLGLLNRIANAETDAECYLNAWAESTPRDDVRQIIATVALREGEHGKAFAKRMCELGYAMEPAAESKVAERMPITSSTTLTDREKFEKLGFGQPTDPAKPDQFVVMFNDATIDIQTGALLGRYISEERDSTRMF